jgi:hypothetical protein
VGDVPRIKELFNGLRGSLISVDMMRDALGFVFVRITNRGVGLSSVTLELFVPWQGERHWIARIDPEGNPLTLQGTFDRGPVGLVGPGESIFWKEPGFSLPRSQMLELRFFVGLASDLESLPVMLRVSTGAMSALARFSATLVQPAQTTIRDPARGLRADASSR